MRKKGMKYALVVGNKVFMLAGQESELYKLAGQKATVKGNVSGETDLIAGAHHRGFNNRGQHGP
jgi:hypothetical protein